MAAFLAHHAPITVVQTISGNTEFTGSDNEGASQTFLAGTPVTISAGNIIAWSGTGPTTAVLAGIALEDAHNLASAGLGAPGPFTGIGFPGASPTFGSVPNEASALNIPRGAPFVTGDILYQKAVEDTIFEGMFDNSVTGTGAAATPSKANIGVLYGLTADLTAPIYWYVDAGKTTVGTNTCVEIVDLNKIDGAIPNARVQFKFARATSQFQ
jgi:hypothetical protein